MPRIAVIHGEKTAENIADILRHEGMDADAFWSADTALPAVESTQYDLILLNSFVAPGRDYEAVDQGGVIDDAMASIEDNPRHTYEAKIALHVLDRIRADDSPNRDTWIVMYNLFEEHHPIHAELMGAMDKHVVQLSSGLLSENYIVSEVEEALSMSPVAQ